MNKSKPNPHLIHTYYPCPGFEQHGIFDVRWIKAAKAQQEAA